MFSSVEETFYVTFGERSVHEGTIYVHETK